MLRCVRNTRGVDGPRFVGHLSADTGVAPTFGRCDYCLDKGVQVTVGVPARGLLKAPPHFLCAFRGAAAPPSPPSPVHRLLHLPLAL